MNRRSRLCAVLLAVLACRQAAFPAEALQEITVKEGDTIWGIASLYLQDPKRWPEILKYNQIPLTDPTAALPGMKLKVPVLLIREELRKATIVYLANDVRYRKKDKADWNRAARGLDLYNEDGIRTMEGSEAHVNFYSGNALKLDENTFVILRPELKFEEVNLLSGGIRTGRVKLIAPAARVTPGSADTVYKARVRPDRGVIVQVEKGDAEVFGLDSGVKVIVPSGHANITIPGHPPTEPVAVPDLPAYAVPIFSPSGIYLPDMTYDLLKGVKLPPRSAYLALPVGGFDSRNSTSQPAVSGGGEPRRIPSAKEKKAYRIQVAADSKFADVLIDEIFEMSNTDPLMAGESLDLPDGEYYRRASYIGMAGEEGEHVDLPRLQVDRAPPLLEIFSPVEKLKTSKDSVSVNGRTETGCFVTVNGYQVSIGEDGKFYWSVVIPGKGVHEIVIVSTDMKGNASREVRTVIKR